MAGNIYIWRKFLALIGITLALILSTGVPHEAKATVFGKNNVNYSYFKWKYLKTEHFNIYYNQDGREIADFAAEVAEESFDKLSRAFGYKWDGKNGPFTLITYQSHNDFEQTNLAGSSPSESTGGFTEFLKNRIVVPFEGDHEKFRHVIHHELTHAIQLEFLFGRGFGAVVAGLSQSRIPLWFTEGLAEYESRGGLDPETEMILRDAVVNDILPELRALDYLGYMGTYKCGQSVIYWIAWRYGDEKIGEILHHLKGMKDFNRALKAAIGIDQKELNKRWRMFIKEKYWPQLVNMDRPDIYANQLTDHEKDFCYINNSPAISPNGQWIAFLSDRSDYFEVYLMRTIDGKVIRRLVKGQRSGKFEELHWLRPGITWSPDGDHIAFCAKSGELDALYIINVNNGKIDRSFTYNSDALFSPSWSPDGKQIALIQVQNGQCDIGVVNAETGNMDMLTNDKYDEADPSWSVDGSMLLFTSNRGGVGLEKNPVQNGTLFGSDYHEFDVYLMDLSSRELQRLTNDKYIERTPIWSPLDNTILFVSNQTGAYNLYTLDLDSNEIKSLSNLATGALQPSLSLQTGALAFSSYYNNGYDIFLLNDPFNFNLAVSAWDAPPAEVIPETSVAAIQPKAPTQNYGHFVFNRMEPDEKEALTAEADTAEVEIRQKDESGKYPAEKYKVSLSPDLVFVNAAYSPYYHMQGSGMILFTDVLGNHQIYTSLDLNGSIEWTNVYFNYEYLARRVTLSTGFYHYAYIYPTSFVYWQDRNLGFFVSAGYPLSKFNRIDFGLSYLSIKRTAYQPKNAYPGSERHTILPHIGYVHDTSIWRSGVEPANGGRWRVDLTASPDILGNDESGLDFVTLSADLRQYINYKKDYSFAFRLSGAVSAGQNPQRFYMGGVMNWFNPRWDNPEREVLVDRLEDIYFASFVTPIRGVGYYNQIGTRYMLGNFEFRFPFIRYLVLGWPLPAYFQNVRGAIFSDIGTAWSSDDLEDNEFLPDKWSKGFGFGLRIDLGIFPIEWDIAWSPDPSSNMGPRYYFSINGGF